MRQEQTGLGLAWFLAGACLGAAVALITASRTGLRLRRMLKEKVDDGLDSVAEAGHDLVDRGRRLAKDGASLAARATHMVAR